MARRSKQGPGPLRARIVDEPTESRWMHASRTLLALAACAATVVMLGSRTAEPLLGLTAEQLRAGQGALLALFAGTIGAEALLLRGRRRADALRAVGAGEMAAAGLSLALLPWWPGAATAAGALLALRLVRLFLRVIRSNVPPSALLLASFLALIAAGTGALLLPAATPADRPIGFVDALFTATSAACVTGLVVRDTLTEFTRFGQWSILLTLQLGGLGIIAFGGVVAVALGSQLGLRATRTLSGSAVEGASDPRGVRRLLLFVVAATLLTQAAGAAGLYMGWPERWPTDTGPAIHEPGERLFHAWFFATSAFCNAGFATAPDSLQSLRFHWTSHLVIAGLVVIGGLGFPALFNLREALLARLRGRRMREGRLVRLNVHTKIVLSATAAAYLLGFGAIFVSEVVQEQDPAWQSALDAHFMSITTRTVGFETIAPAEMGPLARFVMVIQMFVGGSPGSTAGGAKTVAIALLALTVWAAVRNREEINAFGRALADDVVRRAIAVVALQLGLVVALVSVLLLTEPRAADDPAGRGFTTEQLLFESVSATSTVGLSLGVTPGLTDAGKLAVAAGMYTGRVGSLALLVGLVAVAGRRRASYAYPHESVVIS